MSDRTADSSVLYEMAQTIVGQEDWTTAVALRKLAQAGYATLEQVDGVSDWVLLATSGIGIHRLTAVRRLVRPDWQPPRSRVIKVAERFLSATRFALRFWSIEELEALIQDSVSLPIVERPIEKRLSLQQFAQAARKALSYCQAAELTQVLWQTSHGQGSGLCHPIESTSGISMQTGARNNGQGCTQKPERSGAKPRRRRAGTNSERFAYSRDRRREIVERFRAARDRGEVENKDHWARSKGSISGRTLKRYELEFPETDVEA